MKPLQRLLQAVIFLTLFQGVSVASEIQQRADKLIAGWQNWVNEHNITQAAIAVSHDGELVAKAGVGRSPDDPAPIASLSKAITGICVAKLVELGQLTYQDPVKKHAPQLDTDASIGSLLIHASGFANDVTQRHPDRYPGRDREYLEWVAQKEISKGRDPKAGYSYNNANYAMLGVVVRQLTDKTYEEACQELVFEPIGVKRAGLNPDWRIMSAWGGWKISPVEHLKFVNAYFGNDHVVGMPPEELPHHEFDGPLRYGMGYLFRTGRHGGTNFWHDGKWHVVTDTENTQFGAYFVRFDNGWAVSMSHNISAINNEHADIDRIVGEATHLPLE